MRFARATRIAMLLLPLAGCGGGGGSSQPGYGFVTPAVNSVKTFSVSDIDFVLAATNLIDQTITAVNADGTFSYTESIAPGAVVTGTHYRPTSATADSQGRFLTVTYDPGTPMATTCTYLPHGPGPDFPLAVGQTWQLTYTRTCGASAPVTYVQSGSVVDTEPLTLPAGTFAAVKLQSTITFPFGSGTATETVIRWLDASNGHPLQTVSDFNYGSAGTVPANTLISETSVLQSLP